MKGDRTEVVIDAGSGTTTIYGERRTLGPCASTSPRAPISPALLTWTGSPRNSTTDKPIEEIGELLLR